MAARSALVVPLQQQALERKSKRPGDRDRTMTDSPQKDDAIGPTAQQALERSPDLAGALDGGRHLREALAGPRVFGKDDRRVLGLQLQSERGGRQPEPL